MKILRILLPAAIMFCLLILLWPKEILYKEGIYEGTGQGYHGDIKVTVVTDKYKIKEVKILEHQETPELCDIVYDKIPKKVIKANRAEVDVVAGASYTSQGLIDAIKDAVNKAVIEAAH